MSFGREGGSAAYFARKLDVLHLTLNQSNTFVQMIVLDDLFRCVEDVGAVDPVNMLPSHSNSLVTKPRVGKESKSAQQAVKPRRRRT